MNKIQIGILAIACVIGIRANAATIAVTYSFAGAQVEPPVISGTTETADNLSTASVLSGNPSLNAILNPFTLRSHDVVDLTTGLLNGASTITFADGSTLFGQQLVDFTKPNIPETLTFNGGTGEFAGATGSFSGESVVFASGGFTVTGSGTIKCSADYSRAGIGGATATGRVGHYTWLLSPVEGEDVSGIFGRSSNIVLGAFAATIRRQLEGTEAVRPCDERAEDDA